MIFLAQASVEARPAALLVRDLVQALEQEAEQAWIAVVLAVAALAEARRLALVGLDVV